MYGMKLVAFVALCATATPSGAFIRQRTRGHGQRAGFVAPAVGGRRLAFIGGALPGAKAELISGIPTRDVFNDPAKAMTMVAADISGGASGKEVATSSNSGASVPSSTFSLIKNIVGAGILAVPGGVAAFSQSKTAVVPTVGIIMVLGALSGYCFSLIGRTCAVTEANSYGEAWGKSVGEKTAWLPTACCIAKTFFACLSYSIIIGDVFSDIMTAFNAPALLAKRANILCLISSVVLLPLCLLKDLSALGFTSIMGVLGTVYTAVVMGVRYFDGSYTPGGKYFAAISDSNKPLFQGTGALNPMALLLVSMLSTAFVAHFNAPKFYNELKDKTVPRYNTVVSAAFLAAVSLVAVMTLFPFLTFGGNSQGFILNNYATTDKLATLCRVAISISILGGYPLCFMPAKNGILQLLGLKNPTNKQMTLSSVLLLTAFTVVGVVLRDLGFVVSFGGAVLGSMLVFIFPTTMWISKAKSDIKKGIKLPTWRKAEMGVNYAIAVLGVILAVLGGSLSVLKSFVW